LAKLRNERFVLYGGTAIALYLGHRESVDFDFLPKTTDDSVLEVASAEDLLAHKLKVLLQRVEEKDYVDIDALLKSGLDLAYGCGGARALFPTFAAQEALKALTYFNDASLANLSEPLKRRLVTATANVSAIPSLAIASKTLSTAA
jgi:hypothetical protein